MKLRIAPIEPHPVPVGPDGRPVDPAAPIQPGTDPITEPGNQPGGPQGAPKSPWDVSSPDSQPEGPQGAPNTEPAGGETGQSESPPPAAGELVEPLPGHVTPPPVLPKSVVAQKPLGMNDDDSAFWDALDANSLGLWPDEQMILWSGRFVDEDLLKLKDALRRRQPGVMFSCSYDTAPWNRAFEIYEATGAPKWKVNSIFSIKYSEVIANRDQPVHVLYPSSAINTLPDDSFLTIAEMPLVTGPGSRVPVIYRWDMDTLDQAINGGNNPVYNTIWTAGDDQMGTTLTDITKDPKATKPAPAGDGSGDSDSDSGCLSCKGILGCLCS